MAECTRFGGYPCVDDDATEGEMAERKLLARALGTSSFGDPKSVERLAPGYHHTAIYQPFPQHNNGTRLVVQPPRKDAAQLGSS